MWESSGFKVCASDNVLIASDGSGGSRETPKSVRQVAFGVATFSLQPLSDTSFKLLRTEFLGGQVPGRQTVPRAEQRGAIQILSRVYEKSNIQIPIDAKYVTRGIAHRGDLEQGPNGDLWSILFQLIGERSGVTDVIKVKSHLEVVGPSVITQNKIGFHHMLANSLADVVAEEAAKRLPPDLNLERKAKKAERIGIGVAKRLALVQADIWAKRGAAGDIYELEPLVVAEETCTRSAIGKMVDELAQQGLLLIRHLQHVPTDNSVSGTELLVSRGHVQPKSSPNSETRKDSTTRVLRKNLLLTPRRSVRTSKALTVIRSDSLSLCLLKLKVTLHTLNNPSLVPLLLKSVSSVTKSRYVSAQSHLRGMDGKSGKFDPAKSVVNTPLCVTGPRAPLRSSLDDPEEWELPCSVDESVCWDEAHRTEPVACCPFIKCGRTGCNGCCPLSVVEYGHTAWKKPATCEICGKTFPRSDVTLSDPSPAESEGIKGNKSRNSSPAMSRKSSVVSWSDSPREQLEANVLPREQSAPFGDVVKEAVLEDASGSWEPGEPAVISSFPTPVVGGTAPSTCPPKNVTNTPESSGEFAWNNYSYTYCATHVLCTHCACMVNIISHQKIPYFTFYLHLFLYFYLLP